MSEIDYDKLSSMVVKKLEENNRPERDEEFIQKLVDAMVEHRSPCHKLSMEDVNSLAGIAERDRKFKKGKFLVTWGLTLYVIKSIYDFIILNIHWGGQ